jgi:hypothetical protein
MFADNLIHFKYTNNNYILYSLIYISCSSYNLLYYFLLGDEKMEKPEVNIKGLSIPEAVSVCINALLIKGNELNQQAAYQNYVTTMKKEISQSKAQIRSFAVLAKYCRIIQ